MGSWNSTCAMTNLPIFYGEEVYVFLLQAKIIPTSNCHPDFLYGVLPIHFEGKYNDYGAVEHCNGPLLNTLVDIIGNKLVEFELSPTNNIEVKRNMFNINKLFEFDYHRILFVDASESQLTHIVIKKDVLNSLLQEYKVNIYNNKYDRNAEYGGHNVAFIDVDYNYIFNAFKNHIIGIKDQLTQCDSDISKAMLLLSYEPFFTMTKCRYNVLITPKQLLFKFLEDEMDATIDEFVHQHVVDFMLNCFMADSRSVWAPTSGAGSQDSSTITQELRAKLIIKGAEMCNSRWDNE